jgi:GAF domain-containing protein
MTNPDDSSTTLLQYLENTTEQAGELQKVLERALQALSRRGVQIQVDFTGMLEMLTASLEKSQKKASNVLRQLDQMGELVQTSALLTSSLEFDEVLQEVIDTVIKLTGAERAYLMLSQGEGQELKVQVARNSSKETIPTDEITFSHGIINTAIEQKQPLVTTNAQSDERFAEMKSVFLNELRSIIIVPLILKDRVVGVLYADNRIEQGVFSPSSIPLLSAFANQAAIAISNARLFEKVRDDLKEAQRQVQTLLIEIDHSRLEEKVREITDSDYFQNLSVKAKTLREKRDKKE